MTEHLLLLLGYSKQLMGVLITVIPNYFDMSHTIYLLVGPTLIIFVVFLWDLCIFSVSCKMSINEAVPDERCYDFQGNHVTHFQVGSTLTFYKNTSNYY